MMNQDQMIKTYRILMVRFYIRLYFFYIVYHIYKTDRQSRMNRSRVNHFHSLISVQFLRRYMAELNTAPCFVTRRRE